MLSSSEEAVCKALDQRTADQSTFSRLCDSPPEVVRVEWLGGLRVMSAIPAVGVRWTEPVEVFDERGVDKLIRLYYIPLIKAIHRVWSRLTD